MDRKEDNKAREFMFGHDNFTLEDTGEERENVMGFFDEDIEEKPKEEGFNEFIYKLIHNREELFNQVRNRINANNYGNVGESENLKKRQQEYTVKVSDAILDLIMDILNTASLDGELISSVNKKLGVLSQKYIDEKDSQYNFNKEGLTIDLNYTKPSMWSEDSEKIRNFLDDERVDLEYLQRILAIYGVKINRNYYSVDVGDGVEVGVDMVNIDVKKNDRPISRYNLQKEGEPDIRINTPAYKMLVQLRDSVFADVETRIAARKDRERREEAEREAYQKQLYEDTDKVATGILSLIYEKFNDSKSSEGEITSVDPVLGVLGTDPGEAAESGYVFQDPFGLTITLNYSHTKEFESYAECFGNYVDWDLLKQKLLEKGVEISREVREQQPSLGRKYYCYDVVTIKVPELVKSMGMRR